MDKPQDGKLYALTGGPSDKCIANGNSWAESEVVEPKPLEVGGYCRLINTTIFGTYMGRVDGQVRKAYFYDEELGKMRVVQKAKLEPVEKW